MARGTLSRALRAARLDVDPAVGQRPDVPDRRAGAHVDAEARQVAGERVPQGGGEGLGGTSKSSPSLEPRK